MKEYLLSVVAVSLLIILLEIFMSEGNTKKYTQGIIRLILIIVIITPVIKVFSNGIDISDFNVNVDTQQEILIDKTFIQDVVEQRNEAKISLITSALKENNVNADIEMIYDENNNLSLVKVVVKDYCINETSENIFDNKKITKLVASLLLIDENKVRIYDKT